MLNPKLLKEEEILSYLEETFKSVKTDPYDDRKEIEEKIENTEDGINYEVDEESPHDDIMEEIDIDKDDASMIDFEFEERKEEDLIQ